MAELPDDHLLTMLGRKAEDCAIANQPLAAHQQALTGGTQVSVHPKAWLERLDFEALLTSGKSTLVDYSGTALAWSGEGPDTNDSIVSKQSFLICYPWDLLRANELHVQALSANHIEGEVYPSSVVEGLITLGKGSRILPGVYIEGNVVIGENCKIGPNCYIRGNTSIGDKCHIGQSVEIKNCLIHSFTNVGHLSYIGDSILGEKVNLGAGTTISNLRHDGKNHRVMIGDQLVDTARRKFGAIIGDGVHTGINTSIYPGRSLRPRATTRPGAVVERDISSPNLPI